MKILQVITDTDRRGAQVFAMDLGAEMTDQGHAVRTVALAPGKRPRPLNVETLGRNRRGPATLWSLRKLMRGADITIAHGSSTLFATGVAGFPNLPFVYRQISDSRYWANNWRRRFRTAVMMRQAKRIVALSDEAKRTLIDHVWVPETRICVVPNGVPLGELHPPTPEEKLAARRRIGVSSTAVVLCYVGALVPEKGVSILLEALATIPEVEIIVAGDGPERTKLESSALRRLQGRSYFLGQVEETFGIYASSDIVILPSLGGDSMPAVLIEAGLCGLPAIATAVGSIESIVLDGKTGLIVEPTALGITEAISRLISDPKFAYSLGENAAVRCLQAFEIRVIAPQWLHLLEAVLSPENLSCLTQAK